MSATIIGIIAAVIWLYLLFGRGGFWRAPSGRAGGFACQQASACQEHSPSSFAAQITAVIPARDEAASIAQAIDSLRDQTARIIVVDDHSSDRTAAIAREHGATVIPSEPLPAGWTGKMWAVAQGAEAALRDHSDLILLTDADIVHGAGSIAWLAAKMERDKLDLASFMVLLHAGSIAERALMPAFVFFFLMLYPPAWIANPRRRTAGAAGGCMLVRREALERIGGIAAIRGELIDDCALARVIKRAGGRVWLGLTRETRSIREYRGFAVIWNMIARTAFTQLGHSAGLLCGTIAGLAITYFAPPILALALRPISAPLGAAAWLMMSIAYAPMLRLYGRSLWWAPALPLVALFYAGATVDSAIRYWTGRGGEWKGRAQAAKRA